MLQEHVSAAGRSLDSRAVASRDRPAVPPRQGGIMPTGSLELWTPVALLEGLVQEWAPAAALAPARSDRR